MRTYGIEEFMVHFDTFCFGMLDRRVADDVDWIAGSDDTSFHLG